MMIEPNKLEIKVPNIFSWDEILVYLNREPNEVMYKINDKTLRRAFKLEEKIYLCDISFNERKNVIEVTLLNDVHWSKIEQTMVINFIVEWFDLQTDINSFYELAKEDLILNPLMNKFYGLRLVGMPDFYEAITWGILGQQINLQFAYTLKRRFTEKFGEKVTYEELDYWIYPEAKRIAETTIEDLLELKLTLRKVIFLSFEDAKTIEKEMIKIRGIGPWIANYVLMRCFRKNEAFPMADIGLLNGIKVIENLSEKPDTTKMLALKEDWGGWASYATFYIWRLLY
ncbi:DNA-3-methyladenine glycosylase 2 family protein [Vagococcus fluvialis]|uniref:DNA-3-methyladenine glycosylase family protein n=2 Tax=Vagococcus fluvialis TaxID=2738 RepID=UPI001432E6EE|nr:DNA-3-methyladenine glycosylase 2 family protein [Vagococcus fluvialis]NKC58360.1 DNA-3-methyladenine glycosylase 2 family protein [Vagococcus fluvialis]NKD49408.1 DNA-3-methyladenine glycosylase 2 family protein [Vagococcus fluvialis]